MDKVFISTKMEIFIMGSIYKIKEMDMELILIKMEINSRAISKIIWDTGMEFKYTNMNLKIKD